MLLKHKQSLRHYWELMRELAVNDFKLKYNSSALGYVWSLLRPLALFLVLYLVFSVFLRIGGGQTNYQFYLLLGIICWTFFADTTLVAMQSIVNKGGLVKKVYVPKMIIVVAASLTSLMTFFLNLAVFFIFVFIFRAPLNWHLIFFPLYILELYIFSLGLSLILSALYVSLRDLSHIWEIILQVLFYVTPIIYPLNIIPEKYHQIIFLNPLAQIIQSMRFASVNQWATTSSFSVYAFLITGLVFVLGVYIFRRRSPYFSEKI
ncbi:MAG: hypothetical protein COS76_03320 [Candidatus Portnoybacteria bacterium CG06_land_8_20_14_3_00_39_12]|uniref:Transport permease protein n=2 Tax=Candidatus Portnoyibacteriota TaxID=1817913 RepID=A0A2M8KFW3_9BACT|nr:MAG: hypothetical protein COS76_03320 [Candidatus Portnoybacteria bacterium CG06_land_8_20_14_3_00_39_12]PJE58815.1 MAG: hypothetical protein COU83_01805 [Candidatus Portnoybacteria bacterium CG10_big_fil_rev_8_21_14_0_10_40_22]